jgi:non-heme chloroperoxidase
MHQPNGMKLSTTCLATDLRVHYAEQGNPTGDAVIFHHAYVDSWFSYSRVLSLLSRTPQRAQVRATTAY